MSVLNQTPQIILILTIAGIVLSFATLGLLIGSQIYQRWILYVFSISGSTAGVGFTATTTAEIGLWDTDFTVFTDVDPNFFGVTDSATTGTIDSAESGYFSKGILF